MIAPGGGAIVDPRNRWRLFRGRRVVWLDVRTEVLAQRLRRSPNVRPLIQGRDPLGAIRDLGVARGRFYAAGIARRRDRGDARGGRRGRGPGPRASRRPAPSSSAPRRGWGGWFSARASSRPRSRRRSRSSARSARSSCPSRGRGRPSARGWRRASRPPGWRSSTSSCPRARRRSACPVIEDAASQLARLRVERREPIVAVGGGALGDAAGFLAATYLRGIPFIQVPTTLVAQIDSSIGGKTGVDLPEGKNLVGAFHQPASIVIDIAVLATPRPRASAGRPSARRPRWRRSATSACSRPSSRDGAAIAAGDPAAVESGALAEVVERAAWAKVEVVLADEQETGIGEDRAEPRPHARARDRGRGRLPGPAARRGGRVWSPGRGPHRRGPRCDAIGAGGPHRTPARHAGPRQVADRPGSPRGARIHVDRQEARRASAALGPADRRRPRDRRRGPRRPRAERRGSRACRRPRGPTPPPTAAASRS